MPLEYGDVRDIYDTLYKAGVTTQSLPEWSDEMNRVTKTDLYTAGLHDNIIKRTSHSIDKLLAASGATRFGTELGRDVGEAIGTPEAGERAGRGLARGVVNYAPLLIPGAGLGFTAARLGLVGALSGAETYTRTGSPAAGVISGGVAAALPKVASLGEQAVLKRIGGRLVEGPLADTEGNVLSQVRQYLPQTIPQRIAAYGAGQATAAGAISASQAAEQVVQGETPTNPLTTEGLLGLTLGQVPFALLHAASGVSHPSAETLQKAIDVSTKAIEMRQAKETLDRRTPLENIPEVVQPAEVSPKILAETEARLSQVRGEQVQVHDDPTLTPEERLDKTNKLLSQESELIRTKAQVTGETVMGDALTPTVDRTNVIAKEVARNKQGTWRAVRVSDDESNPPELRGKIVGYSTAYEPNPIFGVQTQETGVGRYSLPPEQWRTTKDASEWATRRGTTPDALQPELPQQPREATQEEMFGHIQDLKDVGVEVDAAQTPAQFHSAITKINDVKAQTDLPPTTDKTLRQTATTIEKSGLVAPGKVIAAAVKAEADTTARRLSRREQERLAPELSPEEAAHVSAVMGGEGFSVKTIDQLSHARADDVESKPVSDIVTDTAYAAVSSAQSREAVKGADRSQVAKDTQDFIDLIEHFGSLNFDPRVAAKFLNDRAGTVGWDEGEVKGFLEKPYVKVWQERLEQGLRNVVAHAPGGVPSTEEPFVPQTDQDIVAMKRLGIDRGGQGLLDYLKQSDLPLFKAIGDDLSKFPESLQRITARVMKTDGTAYALKNPRTNEVALTFNHGLLDASETERQITVAHELVHGLTMAELDNPTKKDIVAKFNDLRERVVQQLPKDIKALYDKAVETQWRDNYVKKGTGWDDLTDDWRKAEIVYGLVDNDEFVASGLSSPSFQHFLRTVKPVAKAGWFHRFSNIVREMLGFGERVKGTAFEEFLSRSDQLLQTGEYVAGFRNFGERFYKGLGFSDTLAESQTRRALGLVIDSQRGLTRDDVFSSLDRPNLVYSGDFLRASRDVTQMLQEKGTDFASHVELMDELGLPPNKSGLDLLTRSLLDGDNPPLSLHLLPTASTKYIFAKVKDFRDVLSSIKAATQERNKGLVNIADAGKLRPAVADALSSINEVLKDEVVRENNIREVQQLGSIDADGFFQKVARAPELLKEVGDALDLSSTEERGKFKNWIQQTGQMAIENPETAEALSRGMQLPARVRQMSLEALRPFGFVLDGSNQLSKKAVKGFAKILSDSKIRTAVDRWIGVNNIKGGDEVNVLGRNDPDVQKAVSGLSAEQQEQVEDFVAKQSISTQAMHRQVLDTMVRIFSSRGAVIPMLDQKLRLSQGVELTSGMINAQMADFTNPQEAQAANAQMAAIQRRMNPEAFLELLKFTQNAVEQYKQFDQYFKANPAWATARRMEQFLVKFTRGNKKFQLQASSVKEAQKIAEGGQNLEVVDQWKGKSDDQIELGPHQEELFGRLQELQQNQLNMLRGKVPPEMLAEIERTSPGTQLAREIGATQGTPKFQTPPRLLSQGAEELPWLWNHIAWVNRTANFWSRQLFRAQMEGHLLEPELADRPDLRGALRQHMDNILQPDPAFISSMNKLTATWQMGLSPATAMVIGTHGLIRHTTQLTSMTGKPMDSFLRVGRALNEVKDLALGNPVSEEHQWFLKGAAKDMQIEQNWHDDDAVANEQISLDFKRALMKNKPQTLGQRLGTIGGSVSNASMLLVQAARRTQEQIALLASFDYYRQQGLTREEARDKAYVFNQAVNPVGGRAQRPIGAFSGSDDVSRSIAMLGFNMKSYILGTMGQLARHIQAGFFRPEGLTPAEIHNARVASVQMIGTQMLLAGTLGLPGVGAALGLLNQFFPGLEVNKKFRETMTTIFGGDKNNGSILSDAAMTGLPSMLGWDWASRLSMSNIVPGVSENNGFQPELLLGPSVNIASNLVSGTKKLATGDPEGLFSFVPTGLRKLVKNISESGTVQDYRDREVFKPSAGESVGIALGFNPKRLSDFNVATRLTKQQDEQASAKTSQFHQSVAEQVLKGNFGTAQQQILAHAQEDKTYKPVDGVRAVAKAAEELSFPRDLRREGQRGTAPERGRLLSALGIEPQRASEVDRLNFRNQVHRRLGLPALPSLSEQRVAMLMDQLKQKNPELTRAELQQAAARLLRVQQQQTLLQPEE